MPSIPLCGLRLFRNVVLVLAVAATAKSWQTVQGQVPQPPSLVPAPKLLNTKGPPKASLQIPSANAIVAISDEALRPTAKAFATYWLALTGNTLTVEHVPAQDRGIFRLSSNHTHKGREDYRIAIDASSVRCTAPNTVGIARATASLLQLAHFEGVEVTSSYVGQEWSLPCVNIEDSPECAFRSVMVDIARQPHRIETLFSMVDLLHLYKVRYLSLHLTDDQSFTFPFPGVTEKQPKHRVIPIEAWKRLVSYASARGVTIIPELDLPGHSSILKKSGYLSDPTPDNPMSDADVAHPDNHQKIFAIIDAMRAVFSTSPYFHIGGDESGAGKALIPFLAAVNQHLRSHPDPKQRTRLLVWEGFHGSPKELPATGPNRIIVMSWESSYNPPWALLDAGYEVINASWKPLYCVGGGTPRYPHIGARRWSDRDLHRWNKDEFWHWQAGTPVFEDRGPNDPHPNDGIWTAPPKQRQQIIGGQLLFWEQREHTVLRDSWLRVSALADRLWGHRRPGAQDYVGFKRRFEAIADRMRGLVQPLGIYFNGGDVDLDHPTNLDSVWFKPPLIVDAQKRFSLSESGQIHFTRDGSLPTLASPVFTKPLKLTERTILTAQLFVEGEAIGAPTRSTFDPRPAKVRAAWFKLPRRALTYVPDFSDRTQWQPYRTTLLPELRGPYRTTHPVGQQFNATFTVPKDKAGLHRFRIQTRDGRATLYVNGKLVAGPTDPSEVKLITELELAPGHHQIRVDHASGPISPVLIVAVQRPGAQKFVNISDLLAEIPRGTEPQRTQPLTKSINLLANGLNDWQLFTTSKATIEDIAQYDASKGVLKIAGKPTGYLQSKRWYRDYTLDLEWRWASAKGGNSGLLIHTSTPLLFYSWPKSLEVQLMTNYAGDFWTIGEGVDLKVESTSSRRTPQIHNDLHSHRRIPRLINPTERAIGQWNRMRVLCSGSEIVVTINGLEVNRGIDCTLTEGAISLQSEGTPIEFRNLHLRPLPKSPRQR